MPSALAVATTRTNPVARDSRLSPVMVTVRRAMVADRAALDPLPGAGSDERGLGVGQLVHAQLESGGSWVRPSP